MPMLGVGVAEGVVEAVCVAVGEDEVVAGAVCVTVVVTVVVGCALGVEERDVGPAATTLAAADCSWSVPGDRFRPSPSCTSRRPAMPRANPGPTVTPRRAHPLQGVFVGAGSAGSAATFSAGAGSMPVRRRLASACLLYTSPSPRD